MAFKKESDTVRLMNMAIVCCRILEESEDCEICDFLYFSPMVTLNMPFYN